MTSYNNFDTEIYGDERAQVTPEEFDEVMMLMATDHDEPQDYEGYAEWSESLDEEPVKNWLAGYSNNGEGPSYNGIAI